MTETGCIFCAIARGEAPAVVVADGPSTLTLMSLHPIRRGHVLVIPKRHVETVFGMDEGEYAAVMLAARKAAQAIEQAFSPPRVGMLVAGFDVAHSHVHVLPMYEYHDLTSQALLKGAVREASQSELSESAQRLRCYLEPQGGPPN